MTDFCGLKISVENIYGDEYLFAEVSLPKLLFDNNVQMLAHADVPTALDRISNLVSVYAETDFDAANADLSQIDVSYNWNLTELETYARINAVKLADYPRKMRRDIEQDDIASVYFTSAGKKKYEKIKLYSKSAETAKLVRQKPPMANDEHYKNSIGVLRLEHSLFNEKLKRLAQKEFSYSDIKAKTLLNPSFAEQIIKKDMEILSLNKTVYGFDERIERLREYCTDKGYFKKSKFKRLFATLCLSDEFGADNLVKLDYLARSTFYRERKELNAADVWMSKANRQNLPPLSAPAFDSSLIDFDAETETETGSAGNSNTLNLVPHSGHLNILTADRYIN